MNVLVTGSSGYIGRVAVPALQRAGHVITGYDTGWFGHGSDARWSVIGDIRYPIVAPGWPDVVVHLAGLSNDPMGELHPSTTWEINYWGTTGFVSHFPAAHHVVVSSCAVYGHADHICDETSPVNPQSTYASCKARVDDWVTQRFPSATILRLGTVFGHSPNHRLDTVVNRMVFDALNRGGVTANGNPNRPFVHVEDVASAIVWAVEHTPAGIYNILGENVSILTLAREVASFAAVPVYAKEPGADSRDYMASGRKAFVAGWAPTRSVAGSIPVLFEKSMEYDLYGLDNHIRLSSLRRLIERGEVDPETLLRNAA